MKTSERKNLKRLKALKAPEAKRPDRLGAEKARLLQAWTEEVWRRVKNSQLPPAGALIEVAEKVGLGADLKVEVIKAVNMELGGPEFVSRSTLGARGVASPDTPVA